MHKFAFLYIFFSDKIVKGIVKKLFRINQYIRDKKHKIYMSYLKNGIFMKLLKKKLERNTHVHTHTTING